MDRGKMRGTVTCYAVTIVLKLTTDFSHFYPNSHASHCLTLYYTLNTQFGHWVPLSSYTMPTFIPALGQISVVKTPSASHHSQSPSYVNLSFFITFDHDEDSSGSWEIWTDLPQTNDNDELLAAEGEWHSLRFEQFDGHDQDKPSSTQEPIPSSSTQIVPSTSYPIIQGDRPLTFRATSCFPTTFNKTFGYTYRRVFDSGETHWLGGEGSNGIVSLQQRGEDESYVASEQGSVDGLQGGRWQGLAVTLNSENG
jgi:hypothetical protein